MTEREKKIAGKLSLTKHSRAVYQTSKPYAIAGANVAKYFPLEIRRIHYDLQSGSAKFYRKLLKH